MITSSDFATSLADRYVVERELGAGAMATVYLARDVRHDRPVAIKVLGGAVLPDVQRFHREIHVLANLRHPFILPLHDSGEAAGSLYFVMPLIEGGTLRRRLTDSGPMNVAEVKHVVADLAEALAYARLNLAAPAPEPS